MLGRWFTEPQELIELKNCLQAQIGEDKIYVERAEIKYRGETPSLMVYFRSPLQAELEPLEEELSACVEQWLKDRVTTSAG